MKKILTIVLMMLSSIASSGTIHHEKNAVLKILLNEKIPNSWIVNTSKNGRFARKMLSNDFSNMKGVTCKKNSPHFLRLHYKTIKGQNYSSAIKKFPYFCSINLTQVVMGNKNIQQPPKTNKTQTKQNQRQTIERQPWEGWNTDL
jgi:hypothetical protein